MAKKSKKSKKGGRKAFVYVFDIGVLVMALYQLSPDQVTQLLSGGPQGGLGNIGEAVMDFIQADNKVERGLYASITMLVGLSIGSAIRKKLAGKMNLGNVVAF